MQNNITLLNSEEVARILGIKITTLRKWRWEDKNRKQRLPFVKVSRLVRYKISEIKKFIRNNERFSEIKRDITPE